jgi:hypothetical protein
MRLLTINASKVGEQGALRAEASQSKFVWGLPKCALRDLFSEPADI